MSQKNMEIMLRQEDKAEAEDFTAFLQSLNISKRKNIYQIQNWTSNTFSVNSAESGRLRREKRQRRY